MSERPTAAGGFASAAPTSTRLRPAYARHAIGQLKETLVVGARVLDLRAGTGILTGQLARAGVRVIAVEPVAEMTDQLRRALPSVPTLRSHADALPFADETFDALVVGDRFHQADSLLAAGQEPDAATVARETLVAEAARVLRPGGVLAALSNRIDESVDWVRRFEQMLATERPQGGLGEPWALQGLDDLSALLDATGRFEVVVQAAFPNPKPCTPEQLVERATSMSFVATEETARRRVAARVRALTAEHPDLVGRSQFDVPYCTELRVWRAPA